MTGITPVQLTLFPLPNLPVRAYSYKSAVENGLNPRTYKVPDEPMDAEAILELKVWEKSLSRLLLSEYCRWRKVCAVRLRQCP